MNKQLNNLEVIAEMANLKLKAEVFQFKNESVVNVRKGNNPYEIRLTEDIEKKLFKIKFPKISMLSVEFVAETQRGVIHTVYSNQEAVEVLVDLYIAKYEE
jgi:hypothetical protein